MSNDELESWVSDELFWDAKVDNSAVAVSAKDGDVTLRGTVGSFREKREAQNATERVYGDDEVDLENPEPSAGDVEKSIKKALERNAKVDADDLSVDTYNGTVAVTGSVSSWAEHDAAIAAAWAAPGVTNVDDQITVEY